MGGKWGETIRTRRLGEGKGGGDRGEVGDEQGREGGEDEEGGEAGEFKKVFGMGAEKERLIFSLANPSMRSGIRYVYFQAIWVAIWVTSC